MGQRELARLLGCSVGYLSLLERGLRDPSYITFVSIARALGLPLDELTQGD
jgi:transcriptional regulator with XRE-family HTH domain